AQLLKILQGELDRPLNESTYCEAEILEGALRQALPVVADGHFSVGPEIRRDLLLSILLAWRENVQSNLLHGIGNRLESVLQSTLMAPGDIVRHDPGENYDADPCKAQIDSD